MGCDISTLVTKLAKKGETTDAQGNVVEDKKVLLVGLENSGKTSILLQYKDNTFAETVPTVGLNVDQIKYRSYLLTMWDVGG